MVLTAEQLLENSVVYITTNILNGKKYIGSDSNNDKYYYGSGVNLRKAIKKHGKSNFKKDILWMGDIKYLREMEEYWCNYFNVEKSSIFYNATNKGVGCIKGKYHNKTKKLYQFTLSGDFIKEWDSYTDASNITGIKTIGCNLTGKQKSAGGFIWSHKKELPYNYEEETDRNAKRVNQYDLNMNFIKTWKSAWNAGKFLKEGRNYSSDIEQAIRNNTKFNNYYFKYQ